MFASYLIAWMDSARYLGLEMRCDEDEDVCIIARFG